MSKRIEVKTGQVFNNWTVIEEVEQHITKSGIKKRMIHCRCECGTEKDVALESLTTGKSKQCQKCKKKEVKPNQIFGSWTVIEEVESEKEGRYFSCKCNCGTVENKKLSALTNGSAKQCRKCGYKSLKIEVKPGYRFNSWTIIKEIESEKKGRHFSCKCKCGSVHNVALGTLRNGDSKGCRECTYRDYRISKGLDPDIPMSSKNNKMRDIFFHSVRVKILSRDNGKCQLCFDRAKHVHHIIPWSECQKKEDERLRFDPENCISLCKECHIKAHGGDYHKVDDKIADKLLAKAIENTEKNYKHMKGLKEEALKKVEEIS